MTGRQASAASNIPRADLLPYHLIQAFSCRNTEHGWAPTTQVRWRIYRYEARRCGIAEKPNHLGSDGQSVRVSVVAR